MTWRHMACTISMCTVLIVLGLSLGLNYLFISNKIRMEPPNELTNMLDDYSKNKK